MLSLKSDSEFTNWLLGCGPCKILQKDGIGILSYLYSVMLLKFKSKFKMNGHDFSVCQNLKMATTLTPFFTYSRSCNSKLMVGFVT